MPLERAPNSNQTHHSVTRAIEPRRSAPATLELVPELSDSSGCSDVPVAPGDVVGGRYVVDGMLAAGGMGVVCLATHVELEQRVAVKFLRESYAKNDSLVQRFLNEARAAAVLKSENVVRVIDVGQLDGGRPYLVMEHLEGEDLEALVMREGPFDVDRAVRYALEVCSALAEAHACGIVHRDIKPENLFLATAGTGRQTVKVVDFGLAKRIDTTPVVVTGPQDSMGSPCYMSPEQITTPHEVDARTDIWSLGVVMYRLLTLTMPFDGSTVLEVYARVLNAQPRPLRRVRPDLDRGIEAIVERCLQKEPSRRYQTIGELTAALSAYQASRSGADLPTPVVAVRTVTEPALPELPAPPKRRGPRLFLVAAITLVASFCGAWSVRDDHTRTEARAVVKSYVDSAIPRTSGDLRTALEQADVMLTPVDLPPDPPFPGVGQRYRPPALVAGGVVARHPVVGANGALTVAAERERDATVPPAAGGSVPIAPKAEASDVEPETSYSTAADAARKQEEYRRILESQRTEEPEPEPVAPAENAGSEPLKTPPPSPAKPPPQPKPSIDDLKMPAL
ncbi:MAG TPA: serine/threonine-protein kinase [Polyangiaceae bacterium]|nr:serine/threonine-protein kinase [Polyangiaceae bacterium]